MLQSLRQVIVPDGLECELIVVDNASVDETAAVVGAFEWEGRQVQYLRESRRGLSHARNTGLAAARGEILLFTDDDLRLPRHWLESMSAPILCGKAHAVAGGVKLAPHLERPWMEEVHRSWLASTERLSPDDPEDMVGANMSISRELLSRVPAFDTELGAGTAATGDDTLFSMQIKQAGYRIASAFDVAVEHHCDESRLGRSSYLSFARKQGRMMAYLAHHWQHAAVPNLERRLTEAIRMLAHCCPKSQGEGPEPEGMPAAEMYLIRDLHFYKSYLAERQKPQKYERCGLVKIAHPEEGKS